MPSFQSNNPKWYQNRDWEIVDYSAFYFNNNFKIPFRGPEPQQLEKNKYFVCLGSAHTFGCYCDQPYPSMLQEKLGIQALNLGKGGATPALFLREELLEIINNSKFAVIQVVTARGESNSVFESINSQALLRRRSEGINAARQSATDAYKELFQESDEALMKKLVLENRESWVNNFRQLLESIKVPKILLWFSKRPPNYQETYKSINELWGGFPQLVNINMINQIKAYSDEWVESVSSRGTPQLLKSRFTGKLISTSMAQSMGSTTMIDKEGKVYNHAYPSPEMHIDAADALEPVCRKYIENIGRENIETKILNLAQINEDKSQELREDDQQKYAFYREEGDRLFREQKFQEAIVNYHKSIELNPQLALDYFGLGKALIRSNKVSEAIAAYRHAIRCNSNIAEIHHWLGEALLRQGEIDLAISSYQKAIELNPQAAPLYRGLGCAMQKKGQIDKAISLFQQSIKLNPNYLLAHQQLEDAIKKR